MYLRRLLVWLLAALLSGCVNAPTKPTLLEVIELHTEAMGGRQAIEATSAIQLRLQIVEPSFSVDGVYIADRRGRMRIDIYADGTRVFTEAYDGKVAWQMGQDGIVKTANATAAAALWHGTQSPGRLFGLHEMVRQGHQLVLLGTETVEGADYYVVKLTYSDGFVTHLYLNAKTFLIERKRDLRALHVDLDASRKWLEDRDANFSQIEGVMRSLSGTQVDLKTGVTLQTTKVTALRVNPPPFDPLLMPGTESEK